LIHNIKAVFECIMVGEWSTSARAHGSGRKSSGPAKEDGRREKARVPLEGEGMI